MELITVKAAQTGRVALWERNPAHPGGEVFVAGDLVVQVALTPEVQTRLNNGLLLLVETAPAGPPWDGYDDMDAAAIVERLAGMGDTERIVVRQYEAAHQNRPEVMADTPPAPPPDDTLAGPPWDGYDALSASAIVERLATLTGAEKAAVRAYEAAHKARKTVLEALG